ncbi:sugar ABC transporter ATP-binding protein [Aeromicrobium wangtongii]|uniref:sugar ABC transporter ATP-binding protein n=1 Tax=Aeromicrobium wangtongii TaxID=2969247 RepID=UPI00201745C5|nr:sugar ABC transporter ATP-binding protein [Aeromicrobium wangtongii]MCL3818286.1 sugar ABC transporter ATP-binding protein [Aeromicrobium wangtongii]
MTTTAGADSSWAPGKAPLLQVQSVAKSYGGVHALRGASMTIPAPGMVHGLIGANGSGKSTLLGILSGQLTPDAGTVSLNGEVLTLSSPSRALALGIAMVSQEFAYAPDLTVTENVLMGRRLERSALGINWRASRESAAAILNRLGVEVDVDRRVADLRPDQRQMVEIARALSTNARILILDEPTSSLDSHEAEGLFEVVRTLRDQGVSVVFVSHRLDELFELSDSLTVLRDGQTIAEGPIGEFTPDDVIAAMSGPTVQRISPRQAGAASDWKDHPPLLVVEDLVSPRAVQGVSLTLRRGEIVGLAGQLGSGRSEVLECLFGSRDVTSGRVTLDGADHRPANPREAIRAGLALVPPDRKRQGLVLSGSIRSNLMAAATCESWRLGRPDRAKENAVIAGLVDRMRVRMHDIADPVSTLSGGNQQKIAIGKWLAGSPDVIMLDEPTRGVDIAAKAEVHGLLAEAAANGVGLLVSSSELSELVDLCDRIIVMAQGRVVFETDSADPDEETLLHHMTMSHG